MTYTISRSALSYRQRLVGALLMLVLVWGAPGSAWSNTQLFVLVAGKVVERELPPRSVHRYVFELAHEGWWRLRVEPLDGDVVLEYGRGPESDPLTYNTPIHGEGVETLVFDSRDNRRPEVALRLLEGETSGRYRIELEPLAKIVPGGLRRINAERAMMEGARLVVEATKESRRAAIGQYRLAGARWRELGDPAEEIRALLSLARLYMITGQPQEALARISAALPFLRAIGNLKFEAYARNMQGLSYRWLADYGNARKAFDFAYAIQSRIGHKAAAATTLNNLCLLYHSENKLDEALGCYREALALIRSAKRRSTLEALLYNNIGGIFYTRGEPDPARRNFERGLALQQEFGDLEGEADTLNNLANLYRIVGETQEALKRFYRVLEIMKRAGNRLEEARTLNHIGFAYYSLGEFERARTLLQQALDLRRELNDRQGEARILGDLGRVHYSLGDTQAALTLHRQALRIHKSTKDERREAITLIYLGRDLDRLGRPRDALGKLQEAEKILARVGDRRWQADALYQLGLLRMRAGQQRLAADALQRALALQREVKFRFGEARALGALAELDLEQGTLRQAKARIDQAVNIIESLSSNIVSREVRASFLGIQRGVFELAIDILMAFHVQQPREGWDRQALVMSERARARVLREILIRSGANLKRYDEELTARRRTLEQRLAAKTRRQLKVLNRKHTQEEAQQVADEWFAARMALDAFDSRHGGPDSVSAGIAKLLDAKGIQSLLDEDTLFVEYALGARRSYAWAISREDITSIVLPPRPEIERLARRFYEVSSVVSYGRRGDDGAGLALSKLVIEPLPQREKYRRLVIVADGALQYVPFSALPSSGASAETLLQAHEIVYLPSASVLAEQRANRRASSVQRDVVVFADPVFDPRDGRLDTPKEQPRSESADGRRSFERLPLTREEAVAVSTAAAGRAELVLDFQAARSRVIGDALGRYRFIHFATHGLVDSQNPHLSGLALSMVDPAGRPIDGFLSLADIYGMRLNAELTVLSGCDTALGREIRGEGLIGLTRGFISAGTRQVISSLWRVEDRATAELMAALYRGIFQEGLRPAAALRRAQLSLAKGGRWRRPFHWAGFIVTGDWQ